MEKNISQKTLRFDYRVIRQLYMFSVVAEEGNFSRAAARLLISQPPLTEQIRLLEDRMGVKLLERTPHGTVPTAAGRAALPLVQRFVKEAEQLEAVIKNLSQEHTSVLTLGAVWHTIATFAADFMERMKHEHPETEVFTREINSADVGRQLSSGDILLAFGYFGGEIASGLQMTEIIKEPARIIFSAKHPLAAKERILWDDIRHETFMFTRRGESPYYFDAIISFFARHGFTPDIRNGGPVTQQIAYAGCGQYMGIIPASVAALLPPSVVARPLESEDPVFVLSAAWNPEIESPERDNALEVVKQMHAAV